MAARSAALLALAAAGVAAAPHIDDDLILAALRPAFAARSHGRALQQVTTGTSSTRQEQSPEQLGGVIETPLSRALAAGQDAVPGAEPRPFRLAWDVTVGAPRGLSFGASPDDAQEELDYVQQRLLPALNSFLGRSIRVRRPSGPLDFSAARALTGEALPSFGPDGLDADMLALVYILDPDSAPEVCGVGTVAAAAPWVFERTTFRPIGALVFLCQLWRSIETDLLVVAHEVFHALAFAPVLMDHFVDFRAGGPNPVGALSDGRLIVQSPQVVREVRARFACPSAPGALAEDGNVLQGISEGTAGVAHWEQSVYFKEFIQGAVSSSLHRFSIGRLTDLSLALLQDSGWYDVKYGSGGFSSHGYGAGCDFALANRAGVLSDAAAAKYLCPPALTSECFIDSCRVPLTRVPLTSDAPYAECLRNKPDRCTLCLADYSGDGMCTNVALDNGFVFPKPVPDFALLDGRIEEAEREQQFSTDCHATPGERCLQPRGDNATRPSCEAMSCRGADTLLVNGEPCDDDRFVCPDAGFMCDDPGTLLCRGDLNDCSGKGDCYKGFCYCFIGWGGPDCSVSVCEGECEDGSACPASGFCGVEECGEWSEGPDGRGEPCGGNAIVSSDASSSAGDGSSSPFGGSSAETVTADSGAARSSPSIAGLCALAGMAVLCSA